VPSAVIFVSSKSLFGRSISNNNFAGNERLVAMKAYFDGSGSAHSHFLILSGVVATDPIWSDFETNWSRILKDRQIPAPYLHMKELIALQGAFKGWGKEAASKLVWDCMMYAQILDKNDFRSFSCTIDMKDHREMKNLGAPLPDPYALCCRFCPELILDWYVENFSRTYPQELHFFFDQRERFKGVFETRWHKGKKSGRGLSTHWHLIKSIGVADMRDYSPLQLADLIAWSHNRRLTPNTSGKERAWQSLSKIAETVLPFTRKEIGRKSLTQFSTWTMLSPELVKDEIG
jgi:Protein of unknown function (DUF3800)